jgi:lambda family phage minor tail protein L
MATPVSELQKIAPSSIIELFELQLNTAQHGSNDLYRFHAGTSMVSNGDLVWNGNSYLRFPIQAEGFEYTGKGTLPRPTIRCSNILGTITAILAGLPSGLEGAKVTRIRTMARYIDAVNFPGGTNPYGTPDPTAEFPREVYYIDRKVAETRDVVEWELASAFDLAGVRAPKRQCISNICQWVYKSTECGYTPKAAMNGTYSLKALSGNYSQSGTTITVTSTAHGIAAGDQIYLSRTQTASGTYSQASTTTGTPPVTTPSTSLTVTATAHGFKVGDIVTLTFTSGSPPANGNYTVATAAANSFTVKTASYTGSRSGNVSVAKSTSTTEFYTVATAATNTFTITVGDSSTQSGTYTLKWLKVTFNNHGLTVGEQVYLLFTSGSVANAAFLVATVTTNAFTVPITTGSTASGNVTISQWYDTNDDPVTTLGSDVCSKRLSSCETRFGANSELPFGSFPGVGTYFT